MTHIIFRKAISGLFKFITLDSTRISKHRNSNTVAASLDLNRDQEEIEYGQHLEGLYGIETRESYRLKRNYKSDFGPNKF